MIRDAISTLLECMRYMARHNPGGTILAIVGAFALAGLCWYLCTHYTRLWNLRFEATPVHHVLCGVAAFFTLIFVLTYASLAYAKEVALITIDRWHTKVNKDSRFLSATYNTAWHMVRNKGVERFEARHKPPEDRDTLLPLSHEETKIDVSSLYCNEANKHFTREHPFLSRILVPEHGIPLAIITDDMKTFFANNTGDKAYNLNHGIDLAAGQLKVELGPQTPRVVNVGRRWATLLFLLFQAIPFGLMGFAAYQDLKAST